MWCYGVSLLGVWMINKIRQYISQKIRDINIKNLKSKNFSEYFNSYEVLFSYAEYKDLEENKFLYNIPDKNLTCIFCLKSEPLTIFDDKSHVISYLLGNKFLMHREECITCNKKFGATLETELAKFSEKFRVINGQKNRSKQKPNYLKYQAKSQKALIQMSKFENNFSLIVTGERPEDILKEHESGNISLNFETIYRDSDVYKAFMKIIYGVIPPNHRNNFSLLRSWINMDDHNIKLLNKLIMYQTILPNIHPNNLILNVFKKRNTLKNIFFKKDNYDYFAMIGFGNVIFEIPLLSDKTLRKITNKSKNTSFIMPLFSEFVINEKGAIRIILEMSNTEKRKQETNLLFTVGEKIPRL